MHSARLMRDIVADMNRQGLTVFLTTHNMAEAEEMCDRVAIINKGRIAAIDTPDQLRQSVRSSQYVRVSFEGDEPPESALAELTGVERIARRDDGYHLYTEHPGHTAVALAGLARQKGLDVSELSTCKPNLEDVFLYLTGEDRQKEARP